MIDISLLDILKISVGPLIGSLLGFAASYFFNISLLKHREASKLKLLKHIIKSFTEGLDSDIDRSSTSYKTLVVNLEKWITAFQRGLGYYTTNGGDFSIVGRNHNIANPVSYDTIDGISAFRLLKLQIIPISSELVKLSILTPAEFALIPLTGSLEKSVEDYNKASEKLMAEIDILRTKLATYANGDLKIEDLELPKNRNDLITSLQKMRNYANISYAQAEQLKFITNDLAPLVR